MSWIGSLLGESAGGLVNGIAGAIDTFVETDEEEKAAKLLVEKMRQEPHKWQAEINKIEAGHRSMFVAGARPAILWVCVIGLFWVYIANPIIGTIVAITGSKIVLPVITSGELMPLVYGLLGLGGIRSWEKYKGLTR